MRIGGADARNLAEIKRRRIGVYVEHLFRRSDNADARIFSKELEGKRLRVRIWREKQKRKCRDSIERPKSYN